jgi:type II secretory pathway pseudopilin PulG
MNPWQRQQRSGQKAFTLMELLTIAAILVLLSATSFPSLVRFYEEKKLRQAAIELQSHLLRSRNLAQQQRGSCGLSISNNNGVNVTATPAGSFTGTNVCTNTLLAPLALTTLTGVRGLAVGSSRSSNPSCLAATPCTLVFNSLSVLVGDPQIFYLSGSAITSQYCVDLSLTLIRIGTRNSNSGSCLYTRS